MNINATNPDNPPVKYKPKKIDWDWRDAVVLQLTKHGVPSTIATVAVIDLRKALDTCATGKLTPEQTAEMLLSKVHDVYNKGIPYNT